MQRAVRCTAVRCASVLYSAVTGSVPRKSEEIDRRKLCHLASNFRLPRIVPLYCTIQITENTSFQWHSVLHTITTLTIKGTASTAKYQRAGWQFISLWYITRSDCANLHQYHFADKSTANFSSRIPSKYIIPDSLM